MRLSTLVPTFCYIIWRAFAVWTGISVARRAGRHSCPQGWVAVTFLEPWGLNPNSAIYWLALNKQASSCSPCLPFLKDFVFWCWCFLSWILDQTRISCPTILCNCYPSYLHTDSLTTLFKQNESSLCSWCISKLEPLYEKLIFQQWKAGDVERDYKSLWHYLFLSWIFRSTPSFNLDSLLVWFFCL